MDQKRIIECLGAFTKNEKLQCAKFAQIFKFFREILPEIISAEISATNVNMNFGRETVNDWSPAKGHYITVVFEGEKLTGDTFTVKTKTGQYSLTIPANNDFYNAVCTLLNLPVTITAPALKDQVIFEAVISGNISENITTAIEYLSKDVLRPAMMGVLFDFEKNNLSLVSTDAHRLYISKNFSTDNENYFKAIIPAAGAKLLAKLKKVDTITVKATNTQIQFSAGPENFIFELIDQRYPDYKAVIPQDHTYMNFDRAGLATNIKTILPAANRTTTQINFHLNGSIELSACDIDYSTEAIAKMNYNRKNFPDMDIAFNGNLLLSILKKMKSKEVNMYSSGKNTRAAIFRPSDTQETFLLMPLMIGC